MCYKLNVIFTILNEKIYIYYLIAVQINKVLLDFFITENASLKMQAHVQPDTSE